MRELQTGPNRLFAAALSLALMGAATAPDNLQPESSVLAGPDVTADYFDRVVRMFKDAYDNDVVLRMIAIPSFSKEIAVGVIKDGDTYRLLGIEPSAQLWSVLSLRGLDHNSDEYRRARRVIPENPDDITLSTCEAAIPPGLGTQLVEIWHLALMQTRYPDEGTGVFVTDGALFHFSAEGMLVQTKSPIPPSRPARLVDLALTMFDFCRTKRARVGDALQRQADDLLAELKLSESGRSQPAQ